MGIPQNPDGAKAGIAADLTKHLNMQNDLLPKKIRNPYGLLKKRKIFKGFYAGVSVPPPLSV
ncbi:hypothetical protein [Methanoregula sp.]|jgi:hypothetical protein|uniref:hypothetical protein n=1 Tax=Methanoregula sp. TaxID=2052170 RepID=UPI0035629D9F